MRKFSIRFIAFSLIAALTLTMGCDSGGANEPEPDPDPDPEEQNEAPSASASADETTVTVGTEVTLDASDSSDPDGDALSFSWTLDVPTGSSTELSDDTAEQPTFTPDEAGDYTATVTVDDGNGETDDASVTITAEQQEVVEVSSDINSDETWMTGTLYRVTSIIDINGSATLTIEPGVTVEFTSDAGIQVDSDDAALIAKGTETDRITMTGTTKSPGYWRGLSFNSSHPDNELDYVTIEYGGSTDWIGTSEASNVWVNDDKRVTITNSTIRHSGAYGLDVDPGVALPDFANNTFEDNVAPVVIPTTLMGAMDEGSSFSNNENNYVAVYDRDVTSDMTVKPLDVPYRLDGIADIEGSAQVTIEAGVEMEFTADAGIRVDSDDAALIAKGTEADPILMTGTIQDPGHWRGLGFNSSHPNNELDYVTIEYAGRTDWIGTSEASNVWVNDGKRVTITNSTIRHSGAYGLDIDPGTALPDFANNTFEDNEDAPALIPTTLMGAMDEGSSFANNDNAYVAVYSRDVTSDMTVNPLDVPYRLSGTPDIDGNAQVTIEAGVEMEFTADAGIRVDSDDAALIAKGTETDRITMTGTTKSPGYWRGLGFNSSHPNNELDYITIEYGGNTDWIGTSAQANVWINDGKQLTITNCEVTDSDGWGAYADDGTSANVTYSGNSYSSNADGDNNYGDPGN